jgi:hypothetical protein
MLTLPGSLASSCCRGAYPRRPSRQRRSVSARTFWPRLGLLLSVARPLPFAVAAFVLLAAIGAFGFLILRRGTPSRAQGSAEGPRRVAQRLVRVVRQHRALRAYLIANALWELALSALKAFVILYLTIGLRYKLTSPRSPPAGR